MGSFARTAVSAVLLLGAGIAGAGQALALPLDPAVATNAAVQAEKVGWVCGPFRCHPWGWGGYWGPGPWGPRPWAWHRPVVRCGPYHCWRQIS